MVYLPVNSSILIAGGRNDSLCKTNVTPLLNDLHLFMLDQKVWIKIKYSFNSEKLDFIGNHTMGVITEGDNFEKIIIFGGIQNVVQSESQMKKNAMKISDDSRPETSSSGQVISFLSNKCYLVSVQQRSAGKSFFKEEPKKETTVKNGRKATFK